MKRWLLVSVLLFLLASEASALSLKLRTIQLIEGKEQCDLYPHRANGNESEVNLANFDALCQDFEVSEADKAEIFGFVDEFKADFRSFYGDWQGAPLLVPNYTRIEKQSDAEYRDFLKKISDENSNPCACNSYAFYGRNGSWTAYTQWFKESCGMTPGGFEGPFPCPNNTNTICAAVFFIGASAVVAFLFALRKKKYV